MDIITGILIDVHQCCVSVETIPDTLQSYYDLLDCDIIDIVARNIGERKYLIVCDDEGMLNNQAIISAVNRQGVPMLVGNLFIVNDSGKEDLMSLTQDDIDYIMRYIGKQPMLFQVEYPA